MDNYIESTANKITKQMALNDIQFSNSLIEAQNKLLKYRYLFKCNYQNIDELRRTLDWVIPDYNSKRPHISLKGLTPMEAYKGKTAITMLDNKNIKMAQQKPIAENKRSLCGVCSP